MKRVLLMMVLLDSVGLAGTAKAYPAPGSADPMLRATPNEVFSGAVWVSEAARDASKDTNPGCGQLVAKCGFLSVTVPAGKTVKSIRYFSNPTEKNRDGHWVAGLRPTDWIEVRCDAAGKLDFARVDCARTDLQPDGSTIVTALLRNWSTALARKFQLAVSY
jgi:hypothetical protein